jgi:hypothetical protein
MDDESVWAVFVDCLLSAAARVDQAHFKVARYGSNSVYRERVYCYELYHQLRCGLPSGFDYALHGEIDKSGHTAVTEALGYAPNPDFVVHVAGDNDNLAVIEVKAATQKRTEICCDLNKLERFISGLSYEHGIMLLFGGEDVTPLPVPDRNILVFQHREVGIAPVRLMWR